MLYSRATIPAISMRFQLGASVSTALSLGTTAPMAASHSVALQDAGLGASATVRPASSAVRVNGSITPGPLRRRSSKFV